MKVKNAEKLQFLIRFCNYPSLIRMRNFDAAIDQFKFQSAKRARFLTNKNKRLPLTTIEPQLQC